MPDPAVPQKSFAPPIHADAVLEWYDRHARALPWRVSPRDRAKGVKPDPYRIWLSEVMLQQTTVAAVGRYFARFTSLWPTLADLAAAPLESVLMEWAGLGYYARARNLHACAQTVARDHGGVFPATAAALRDLPGIGDYTSAAIAAITRDERIAVLDGNVERVLARYLALPVPVREAKPVIRSVVQAAMPTRAGDFAQALMDLGATICAPKAALCMVCPLQPGCVGTRTGAPLQFPVKPPKPERPVRHGHAFVITNAAGEVYLQTRGSKGLLAKMTEVPGTAWEGAMLEPSFPFSGPWQARGRVVHVFTHFKLELDVWSITASSGQLPGNGWWADPKTLGAQALPTLFRKVLAQAGL